MLKGLIYATFACLLWGATYVTPSLASTFSAPEVLLGRYLAFGVFSLLFLMKKTIRSKVEFKNLPPLKVIIILALVGFFLYDLIGIMNIRFNGSEAVGLIYGVTLLMFPVFMNLIAQKKWPARIDLLNILFPFCGLLILEWEIAGSIFEGNWIIGWGIAIAQGILWVYFTRKMSFFTKSLPDSENTAGNTIVMIGVACLLLSLVGWLYFIFSINGSPVVYARAHSFDEWMFFAAASLLSGIGTNWLATHLWCIASLRLPYQILSNLLLADVAAGKIYELILTGESLSMSHVLGIGILFGSGAMLKMVGAHYKEDPCLAEIDIGPANVGLGILPQPILEIQLAAEA